tara:strand:+ start:1877 stop:2806 length:930 start_codon:yes stop_codon:yes gene_type:complete
MWGFGKKKSCDKRKEQQGDFGEIGDIDINVCKEPDKYSMSFRKVHRSLGKTEFEQACEMKNKHTFELGDIIRHKAGTDLYIVGNNYSEQYWKAKSLCFKIRLMRMDDLLTHGGDMVRVCNIDDFSLFRKNWFIDLRKYDSGTIAAIIEYLTGRGFSNASLSPVIFENKELFITNRASCVDFIYKSLVAINVDKNNAPEEELVFESYQKQTIAGCKFVKNDTLLNKRKVEKLIVENDEHRRIIDSLKKKIIENEEQARLLREESESTVSQTTQHEELANLITEARILVSDIEENKSKLKEVMKKVEILSK